MHVLMQPITTEHTALCISTDSQTAYVWLAHVWIVYARIIMQDEDEENGNAYFTLHTSHPDWFINNMHRYSKVLNIPVIKTKRSEETLVI